MNWFGLSEPPLVEADPYRVDDQYHPAEIPQRLPEEQPADDDGARAAQTVRVLLDIFGRPVQPVYVAPPAPVYPGWVTPALFGFGVLFILSLAKNKRRSRR